uniref:Uncharacterized protein n=1 Tax=Anguilla anguilla TaxID=7936 RepID=A0A0E9VD74_ANGAN
MQSMLKPLGWWPQRTILVLLCPTPSPHREAVLH